MQRSRTARLIRGGDPHSLWSRQPDLECLHQETPHVRVLVNRLRCGTVAAVAGAAFNPDQNWCGSSLCHLQGGRELEAVPRHDPVTVISGE